VEADLEVTSPVRQSRRKRFQSRLEGKPKRTEGKSKDSSSANRTFSKTCIRFPGEARFLRRARFVISDIPVMARHTSILSDFQEARIAIFLRRPLE
jgi:hypothetical protein